MDGYRAAKAAESDHQLVPAILDAMQCYLDNEINKAISTCNENIYSNSQDDVENDVQQNETFGVNNDEMLLRQPLQVSRNTIQPSGGFGNSEHVNLAQWLITAFRQDLREKIGVEYNWRQLRLLLIKARIVMSEIIRKARMDCNKLPREIIELYSHDSENFTNTLFSIFIYTCNYCDCTCETEEECMRVALGEREVLNGNCPTPNYTTSSTHPRVNKPPPNTAAFGWNCAIFALLNWPTRISKNIPETPEAEKVIQEALVCCEIFKPLSTVLTYALNHLHPISNTIFRGIGGKVEYPYSRGDIICWPSFSSTSVVAEVAQTFMKNEGTFFIINTRTASMINWYTWFSVEEEALLKMNSIFEVQGRMSNTLLSMLGSNSEIIFMRELGGEDPTPSMEADIALKGLVKSRFIYTSFLETYVMGFLSPSPNARVGGLPLDEALLAFSEKVRCGETCANLVVMGMGGAGKTSSMLYMLSSMMENVSNQYDCQEGLQSDVCIIPMFVPLPVAAFCEESGIDSFILRELNLSESGLHSLSSGSRRLVVMLDSLDEVNLMSEENCAESVYTLLQRNPLLCSCASGIILSSRVEFCKDNNISPANIFHRNNENSEVDVLYVQPFDDDDMTAFISKVVQKNGCPHHLRLNNLIMLKDKIKNMNLWEHVRSPFLLFMLVTTLSDAPTLLEKAKESMEGYGLHTLYESYFMLLAQQRSSESLVADATIIAFALHCDGVSQGLVTKYGSLVPSLIHLPLRVENAYVDIQQSHASNMSTLCFRHKTLQEFLVARHLFNICCTSLQQSREDLNSCNYLSKSPNVVKHFSDHLCRSLKFKDVVCSTLAALVNERDQHPVVASNALTLLSQSRVIISSILPSLSGIRIHNANLDGAILCGVDLSNAILSDCSLKGADMSYTNTAGMQAPRSEIYQFPSLKAAFKVSNVDVQSNGNHIVVAGEGEIILLDCHYNIVKSISFAENKELRVCFAKFSSDGKFLSVGVTKTRYHEDNITTLISGSMNDWLSLRSGDVLSTKLKQFKPTAVNRNFEKFSYSDCSKYILLTGKAATILDLSCFEEMACYGPQIQGRNSTSKYECGVLSPDSSHLVLFDGRFDVKLFRFYPQGRAKGALRHVWTRCSTSIFKISGGWGDVRDNNCAQNSLDGKYLIISGSKMVAQSWAQLLELDEIDEVVDESVKLPAGQKEASLQVEKEYNGQMYSESSFVQSPDGRYILMYYSDVLVVFDSQTTAKLSSASRSEYRDIALNVKSNHILLYNANSILVYDFNLSAMELVFRDGHMNELTGVFCLPDNSHVVSSGFDSKEFIHSTFCNSSHVHNLCHGYGYKMIFSPCSRLACIFSGGTGWPSSHIYMYRYDITDCSFQEIFQQRTGSTPWGCFSPCGNFFAYSYCSYEWGHENDTTEDGDKILRGVHIVSVDEILSVDSKNLNMKSNTGWKPEWSEQATIYENCFGVNGWVFSIAWKPNSDGICIAFQRPHDSGGANNTRDIIYLPRSPGRYAGTLNPLHTFKSEISVNIQYSSCGEFIYVHSSNDKSVTAVGGSNGTVLLENVLYMCPSIDRKHSAVNCELSTGGCELKIFRMDGSVVRDVAISYLSQDGPICPFQRSNSKVINIPSNYSTWTWSNDSTKFAVAKDDGYSVAIISRSQHEEFYHHCDLKGFLDLVTAIDFSPHSDRCVVGSADAAVRIFIVPDDGCVVPILFCSLQQGPETSNFSGLGAKGVHSIEDNANLKDVMLEFMNDETSGEESQKNIIGRSKADCYLQIEL